MAQNTKAQKLELDMEQALTDGLDLDFSDDFELDLNFDAPEAEFSLDDLESQISRAAEELALEQNSAAPIAAAATVAATVAAASTKAEAKPIDTPQKPAKSTKAEKTDLPAAPVTPAAPPVVTASAATPGSVTVLQAANQPEAVPLKSDSTFSFDEADLNAEPAPAEVTVSRPAAQQSVPAQAATPFTPANDDLRNNNLLLRRTNGRNSNVFWTTTAISALWTAGGLTLAHALSPQGLTSFSAIKDFFATPSGIGVAAGIAVPVVMFWGFAQMVRRAQELQSAARQMTAAALRLASPEAAAGDRVSTLGQAVRREVAAMNEGIERTLARAVELETLVQTEVHQLERAYSDNEVRIRALIAELGNEREAVISHAERVRSSISGAHEHLKTELSSASDIIRDNVLTVSSELTSSLSHAGETMISRLNESGAAISEAIDTRSTDISTRISSSGGDFVDILDTRIATLEERSRGLTETLTEALDARTSNIASLLGDATMNMVTEFDQRLADLNSTLAARGHSLLTEFEGRAQAIDSSTEKLNAALEVRSRQINENLIARTREIAETFSGVRSSISTVVDETKDKLNGELSGITDSVAGLLNDRAGQFISQIADSRETLSTTLSGEAERIAAAMQQHSQTISERGADIERAIAGNASTLDQTASQHAAILEQRTNDMREAMAAHNTKLNDIFTDQETRFDGRASALKSTLDQQHADYARTLDERNQQFSENLQHNSAAVSSLLNEHINTVGDRASQLQAAMQNGTEALDANLRQHGETLVQRTVALQDAVANATGTLQSTFDNQTGIIEERTSTMERALSMGVDNVRKSLEHSATVVAGTLREKITEAAGSLSAEAAKAGNALHGFGENFNDRLIENLAGTEARLGERASQIASGLEAIETRLTGELSGIESRIAETATRTSDVLGAHSEAFSARVLENLSGTENRLTERAEAIASGISDVSNRLTGDLSGIETRIAQTASHASDVLGAHSEAFSARVLENLSGTEARLTERADAIAMGLGEIGSRITGELGVIESRISDATQNTSATLEERTRELNSVLAARSQEITRILADTAEPLVQRLADSGQGLASQLEQATHAATDRLRTENAALVNALASRTAETISAVQEAKSNLSQGVGGLIDRLASSNAELGQLIDKATHNLNDIDTRLVESTTNFADSTNRAAQIFSSSSVVIDNNIGALRSLSGNTLTQIADIAKRFEDHSAVLSRASDLINVAQNGLNDTLSDRHDALERLSAGLIDKSENIEKVMQGFETLVTSALERTEGRTRNSTEQLRAAISEVVDQATQKFASATDDIRRSAAEIRGELDATRGELKRGVLDMPAEAKESTTAMRKAVSEQINALKELASIVNKSGRLVDVGDSRADRTIAKQTVAAAAPAQAYVAPAVTQTVAPTPAPQQSYTVSAPVQAPAPQESTRGGWVSNLLARASADEDTKAQAPRSQNNVTPQRSAAHVVDSLNSLSVDIARAIDHEASVELWDRYRRGERNVFTRRLYTLKGQQTFEEIKSKYQMDGDFRRAVDRYMDDFQRLLEDVARNDRDNMVTQTYLTSDTGKVYTMLAHASGRLR
ncbi:apolipoprotein A-IV repeat region-like domain-containing protein [Pseudochrobactrum kiredjianiae]|uniref:Kinesin n=1 Tax=Pseudochrobactrum kiredjianiae TaxID=386305 RepID=A0ABW3V2K3_9HYPH|nr:kinesin [Pseudochrobactrum kiredjianiae]MDM7851764.1 kinesin [Pseudochrobactrum kiredjianiae]